MLGNLNCLRIFMKFLGLNDCAISLGTEPTRSNLITAFEYSLTKNGERIAPIRFPINAANIIILKFETNTSGVCFKIAVSTMPPKNGAWNMFESRATSKVPFTKDKDVAIFPVLTPASLRHEAEVSAKWIIAVKKQTISSAVIYEVFFLRTGGVSTSLPFGSK